MDDMDKLDVRFYFGGEIFFVGKMMHYLSGSKGISDIDRYLSVFNRLPTEGYSQGGKFWVRRYRDQKLEGARNTKLRQVRAARCVTPYVLYGDLYCLWCRMI
jgi:hypothetical protein